MLILAAGAPILLILLGFARGFTGWQTGLLALMATGVLAGDIFHTPFAVVGQAAAAALFTTLATVTILCPALLLYALVQASGAIASVSQAVRDMPERDLLVLFLVLGISSLLEAICGFGTGIVVCVPLYLALGITPQRAALLGLLGESTSAYASMGNALSLEAGLTDLPASALGMHCALLVGPYSFACACLALMSAGGPGALRRWWLVAGGATFLLVSGEWAASELGVACAGTLSSLLVCLVLGGLFWWRRRTYRASQQRIQRRTWKVILLPFSIVLGGQLLVREVAPLRQLATQSTLVYGTQHLTLALHPGTWLLLACASVLFFLPDRSAARAAWMQTLQRVVPLAVTVGTFLIISSLMQVSGMMMVLIGLFAPLSGVYLEIAPLLGVLGGWITGSNTSSNALLSVMQVMLAKQFHLHPLWIAAAQNAAASFGRLVAPICLYLASHTAGVRERALLVPTWWLVAFALAGAEVVLAITQHTSLWILLGTGCAALLILFGALRSAWPGFQREPDITITDRSPNPGKESISPC